MSTSAVDDSSASGAGASGSKFCLRAFELSFDYLEEISSVFANARAGGRSCTWEMLNNEDVLAAIEKQMLQLARRYLRDCRSAHLAAGIAKAYIRRAFDPVYARVHPAARCRIAVKASPNMLQDFQCVAMVICLSCLWISAKMESQVPFVSLQHILLDYLQQSYNLCQQIKSYTLMTETDILQTLEWDIERPCRLSLSVLDQSAAALRNSKHRCAPKILHCLGRLEDSLLHFVAQNRTSGTRACLSAKSQLLELHKVPQFQRTRAHTTAAEDVIVQVVANCPTVIYPLAALKCVIALLNTLASSEQSLEICASFGIDMTLVDAMYHANLLSSVFESLRLKLLEESFGSEELLGDFIPSTPVEIRELTMNDGLSKFVTVCTQACTKFLESRLRVLCSRARSNSTPQSRRTVPQEEHQHRHCFVDAYDQSLQSDRNLVTPPVDEPVYCSRRRKRVEDVASGTSSQVAYSSNIYPSAQSKRRRFDSWVENPSRFRRSPVASISPTDITFDPRSIVPKYNYAVGKPQLAASSTAMNRHEQVPARRFFNKVPSHASGNVLHNRAEPAFFCPHGHPAECPQRQYVQSMPVYSFPSSEPMFILTAPLARVPVQPAQLLYG